MATDRTLQRRDVGVVGAAIVLLQVVACLIALVLFHEQPPLLAAAALAWGLGLRHALDPDHLAVIDNAVRASIDTDRPAAASGLVPGLWFALGHSTVVAAACAGIAAAASGWRGAFEPLRHAGEVAGPIVSSTLLLIVASLNAISVAMLWRRGQIGGDPAATGVGGAFARVLWPLKRRLAAGRAMFPIGLLMGLGFDTASEIALLALSAAEAAKGLPLAVVLVFPALFAVGMAAVDAANGWLMLRTYRWAAGDAGRRRACNLGVTATSSAVAFAVAGWQLWDVLGG